MFKDYWSKAIVICLTIAILVVNLEHLRKILYVLAYATVLLVGTALLFSGAVAGRLTLGEGSLSNPNEIAGRLLTGLCFCLFVVWREPGFSVKKIVMVLTIPVLLLVVLRTGSRSGLLTLVVLLLLLVLRASAVQKVLLVAVGAVGLSAIVATLPTDVLQRYSLMFATQKGTANQGLTDEEKMAVGSRDARQYLAGEAYNLTLSHPLFGVGPGVYAAAAAEQANAAGKRAMWHETHNTYLQVSAEDGILGLVIYLCAIVYCLQKTFSIYRRSRNQPDLELVANLSYCLLMALSSWVVGAIFDSQAYRLEFPMMAALTSSFALAAVPQIEKLVAKASPVGAGPFAPTWVPTRVPAPVSAAVPAAPPPPVKSNPYRFGRMRLPR